MRGDQQIQHLHQRRRIKEKKLRNYPSNSKGVRFLDKIMLLIAVAAPIMTIPQITKIYLLKNAAGVSTITWGAYILLNVPWLIYGFVHKEKPIIISTILWLIINTLVLVGALIY